MCLARERWGVFLLAALGCASPRYPLSGLRGGEAPPCMPGTLVFAASQAPQAIAASRDGKLVAVADRGTLVLRDAETLAPVRYLVPQLDHWQDVAFSRDGRSLRASTVDGLRFRIDVASGRVERLLNDDRNAPREALMDDQTSFFTLYARRATAMKDHERAFWHTPPPSPARFPSLPAGVESNGIALGVLAEVAGGRERRLAPLTEIEAKDDGDHALSFIAGSDGKLRAFDMDGRQVAEGAAPAGAEIVRVGVGGDRVLVSLADGGAAIYGRSLALERRVRVLVEPTAPPPRAVRGLAAGLTIGEQKWPPHALRGLDYDPARGRLIWLSTAHEIGVLDVASGRAIASLPGTASFEGVAQMAFVGQRLIAAVAGERLWVWDPYDGGHADLAGGYLAMAPLAGGRVLALGGHGQGDVVEIDRTRWQLTVRRTVCLAASGDCRKRALVEEIVANHGRMPRRTQRELAASPRGAEIAVFEWPWQDPSSGDRRKGRLAVLSADTLEVLRSTPVEECERDDPLEFGARQIVACGVRRDATTLAPLAPEASPSSASRSDNAWPKPGADPLFDVLGPDHQRIALGRASIGIGRQSSGGYESIVVANAKGELVGMLANTASADVTGTRVYDRGQLRSDTTIVPSLDGSRFLIAGRGIDGALQLWCTPTDGLGDLPPEPPRPDLMEQGGITEIAVRDFPVVVYDAVEMSGEVLMLGVEPHPPESARIQARAVGVRARDAQARARRAAGRSRRGGRGGRRHDDVGGADGGSRGVAALRARTRRWGVADRQAARRAPGRRRRLDRPFVTAGDDQSDRRHRRCAGGPRRHPRVRRREAAATRRRSRELLRSHLARRRAGVGRSAGAYVERVGRDAGAISGRFRRAGRRRARLPRRALGRPTRSARRDGRQYLRDRRFRPRRRGLPARRGHQAHRRAGRRRRPQAPQLRAAVPGQHRAARTVTRSRPGALGGGGRRRGRDRGRRPDRQGDRAWQCRPPRLDDG